MRPRIAVNCDVAETDPIHGSREKVFLYTDYLEAIFEAGGEPLLLPSDKRALSLLELADGVLLTGGDDYRASVPDPNDPPPRFTAIHPRRDNFDSALWRELQSAETPVLGICAGFQLMVIEEGGSIYGDICDSLPEALQHRREAVDDPFPQHSLDWSSREIEGVVARPREVMSHHHQGVSALPPNWHAWATAPDGVVEAAIGPGAWRVGIQWHPELQPQEPIGRELFTALIHAASERRGR